MKPNSSKSKTAASKSDPPYVSVFILTLATFMASLDAFVVNVSLPQMAADLSSTPTEIIWIITSYIIATAAILPISGWLATYFGRKRYYMFSVFCFTVTSVLCGLATNLETLVFFRVLQGLSAGGIAPSEQAIIADITPQAKLGRTFAIYGLGVSVAPVLGPTLGGFITDTFSWHWIFFINLPIGIISLILVSLFVKESKQAEKSAAEFRKSGKKIDFVGIFLFVTGIAAFVFLLDEGPKQGWLESDFIVFTLAYTLFSLVVGITWEYYQKAPAVDISMFKNRAFTGACLLLFTVSFVVSGIVFIVPFFMQTLLGYSATDAGLNGLPGTLCQLIIIQIVGYASDKMDIRKIIFVGLIITTVAVWSFSQFNLNTGYYDLMWARVYFSIGIAFLATTINTAAYYGIPPEKNNSASALLNLVRTIGASLGVSLTSTIIAVQSQVHISGLSANANLFNANYTQAVNNMAQTFQSYGLKSIEAIGAARGVIWQEIIRQGTMNAILDAVNVYIILHLCVIALVFLLKRKKTDASETH